MSAPPWRRYLRFWGDDPSADVDDEIRFHIESRTEEYIASGLPPDQARAEALHRFGNLDAVREHCASIGRKARRERRPRLMLQALLQDTRYAVRTLRRNPVFTIVAVLTLALGIGANTAIFSVIDGVLLRPLPYPSPDRLVRLFTAFRGSGVERYAVSQPEFMDYKGLTHIFENAAAFTGVPITMTGRGEPELIRGIAATRDLFPVLGASPTLGRSFQGDEGRKGVEPVVVLSHALWTRRFASDPAILGRTLVLNGIDRRVVGILPPGLTLNRADAYIPHFIDPADLAGRAMNYLRVVARLRAGVGLDQAQRELNALTRRLNAEYPNVYVPSMGYGATAVSMHDEIVGEVRPALLILLGAVGLVLLICCVNVANLVLARGEARRGEIAMRLALGAGRGRIVRQILTESAVLGLFGAAVGLPFAWWGIRTLLAVNPRAIPRTESVGLDLTVGLVTLGLALLTAVLFGLAPALRIVRNHPLTALKQDAGGVRGATGHQRLGRGLVAAEIALAVVVVIGASLLVRSFWTLRGTDPGFIPDRILALDLTLPAARYDAQAATAFYRRLVEVMGALPGVRVAAAASDLPPDAGGNNWDVSVEGRALAPDQAEPSPNIRIVTDGYFRALSIPILRGRLFTGGDSAASPPVAVLNETAARAIWPDRADPIGQRVRFSSEQPWVTVVGVVRDVHSMGLGEPAPAELYLLHEQLPAVAGNAERAMYVVLKTETDPASVAAPARVLLKEADPLLAVSEVRTMTAMLDLSVATPRLTMLLLTIFGGIALLLAAIGIYGLMSYSVKRRTREIGIRMALGARPPDVLRMILADGMRLSGLGLAIGLAAAFFATRLMESLLFGVSPTDPLLFGASALLLALVALVASWIPARRAILADPMRSLHTE